LHLKFRVVKITRGSHKAEADLAESVLSVAESFVHDELTDQEEAGLWESIHSSAQHESEENAVPGGLDPFISSEEELQADPTGVSLFATLIERLLARFEFDAQDIQVSITDPDNVTLRFCLAELQYSTTTQPDASLEGIRRTLTLKGIDVFTTNHLRPSIPSSPSTTRPSSPIREGSPSSEDGSPRSSNSSLDEETEMRMSQSIAVFPPRPVSPSESTSGSIYHSIVEQSRSFTSPQREAVPQPAIGTIDAAERRFMSFGSTPISIHLTTPSPGDVAADGAVRSPKENITLGLQSGALAIAVLPWQIVGLSRLAEKLTSIPSSTPTQSEQPNSSPQSYAFEASIDLKGICILLLPSPESTDEVGNRLDDYFTHAFTPPALSVGYTRILVDTITGRATVSSSDISSQLSVTDLSVFQHFGKSSDAEGSDPRSRAIPVLITDPYLPIQYDKPHHYPSRGDPPDSSHSQPTLRTVDRRNPRCATFGGKLSHWRTRSQQTTPAKAPSTEGHGPCLSFSLHRSSTKRPRNQIKTEQRVQLDVAPLSIFVDLEMTLHSGGIFSFVDTLLLEQSSYERFFHEASDSPQAFAQDTSDAEDESPFHDPPTRVAPASQGPVGVF
jgi:autophagy-related protein 2